MDLNKLTAYEVLSQQPLNDFDSTGYLLRHKKTGAKISIISNNDENKVFYIGFRTPVMNSTGVPHIIEHTVLCGSEQFPLKDPFIELAKGSMNTFLNAMTWPDKTVYPVASCNDKDFQNLMHVYMDAVFHPNIYKYPEIFKQEGWHYELNTMDEPITINGVVYNEMKGAYSSPDSILESKVLHALYPDTTYGHDSGGNPDVIPTLTREDYLDFHRTYYHPSNSYIYLYGDMDIIEKLNWMDENYLSHYDYLEVDSKVTLQPAFLQPVEVEDYYSISSSDSEEDNTYLSYSVSIDTALNKELYIAFEIIDYALFGAQGAPVKQALLDAGFAKDISSSYDNGIAQPFFSIVAKGANPSDKEMFMKIIRETLEEQVAKGINKKSLLAAINGSEFRYRESDYGQFPKGLMTGLQILDSWLYDESKPYLHIQESEVYSFLREMVDTDYFEQLVQKYLLDNKHAALVTILPKIGLNEEKEKALAEQLAQYKASLTEEECQKLIEETKALAEYQEAPASPEELECIPLLSREDMRKEILPIKNDEKEIAGVKALHHNYFTNGIIYTNFLFDIHNIKTEWIPYVGLLKSIISYIDMEHYSYADFTNEVNLHTGGISMSTRTGFSKDHPYHTMAFLDVKMKTLYNKMGKGLELIEEMLFHTLLEDDKRLQEIIGQVEVGLQSQISSAGHTASANRAVATFMPHGWMGEQINGIAFYEFVADLVKKFEDEKTTLKTILRQLIDRIFTKDNLMISITCDDEGYAIAEKEITEFIQRVPDRKADDITFDIACDKRNIGFMDASQVQYVARAGYMGKESKGHTGTFRVLKTILSYDYLWNQIRVHGGAYGAMCGFSREGVFYFTSYRDPNLAKTFEVYKEAPDYIANFQADEREMTKYMIGTFSSMDTPLNPSAKGARSLLMYLSGTTEEELQADRNQVLNVQPEDIRQLAPFISKMLEENHICVVGNENKIKEEQELFDEICSLKK